jgi:3-oxoacyl-(acyl-carrier-protein) synthase
MDARPEPGAGDPLIVTGLGHAVRAPCDPAPFLKVPKMRKYMGTQDDLAVAAAGRALSCAGLLPGGGKVGPERIGLYLVVGYIPFESADIEPLVAASLEDGAFSMQRFSTEGFRAVNGLLTFRCLPNMPAFHVSVNFDVQGPYFVTYPGPAQFYLALEAARTALEEGEVDVALVGGVAHQRNFLVAHHFARIEPPVAADDLRDAAGFLVLERRSTARGRGADCLARLLSLDVAYERHNPFEPAASPEEWLEDAGEGEAPAEPPGQARQEPHPPVVALGAASLPAALSQEAGRRGRLRHHLRSRDGFICTSAWEFA